MAASTPDTNVGSSEATKRDSAAGDTIVGTSVSIPLLTEPTPLRSNQSSLAVTIVNTRDLLRANTTQLTFVDVCKLEDNRMEMAFAKLNNKTLLLKRFITETMLEAMKKAVDHFEGSVFVCAGKRRASFLSGHLTPLMVIDDSIFHMLKGSEKGKCDFHPGDKLFYCPCYVVKIMAKKYHIHKTFGEDVWNRDGENDFIFL